ncbi:hypothetical protein ACTXT7_006333 [Hymenolepis weldensis]
MNKDGTFIAGAPISDQELLVRPDFIWLPDEKNQRLKSNVWLRISWYDYRLVWNPSEYAGIESINIAIHKLWKPEIVVLNKYIKVIFMFTTLLSVDGEFEATFKPNVVLQSDGHVLWIPPIIYKTSCEIDVKYFPFDEQTCRIDLGSWIYTKDEVELQFYKNQTNIDLSDYVPSGVWDFIEGPGHFRIDEPPVYDKRLKASPHYRHGTISNRPPTSRITFKIVLRRKPLFYITNIIIPCVLIALLGICVFCLPTDAGEKITLSISILVTIVVYMILVSKMLPAGTKSIPLLSKFLLFTFAMTFLSLCITAAVIINLNHRNSKSHPKIPKWVRRVFMPWLRPILHLQRKIETNEESNSTSDTDESEENSLENEIREVGSTLCNSKECSLLGNFEEVLDELPPLKRILINKRISNQTGLKRITRRKNGRSTCNLCNTSQTSETLLESINQSLDTIIKKVDKITKHVIAGEKQQMQYEAASSLPDGSRDSMDSSNCESGYKNGEND